MPVPVTVREILKRRDRGQATANRTARKGGPCRRVGRYLPQMH